jgi:hypothetical protein
LSFCDHVTRSNRSLVDESYVKFGIKSFWLDNSEPWSPRPLSMYGRPGAVGSSGWSWADSGALFDVKWPQLFHDGLVSTGETEVRFVVSNYCSWFQTILLSVL